MTRLKRSSNQAWRSRNRAGITRPVLAVVVIVLLVISGGVGAYLGEMATTSTVSSSTSSTTSASLITITTSSTTSSTTTSHGSIIVLAPNYNFTVQSQVCKYFNFTDNTFYGNFTGSFTANPEVAMYLLNQSSWSFNHFTGSSIIGWVYASTGSENQTLANHLMVPSYEFNVPVPENVYYLGFCDWTNGPTTVATNSTGISLVW